MSQIVPKKKDSIKILLLCSYDKDTLTIVKKLSDKVIREYGSEDYEWSGRIVPVIARNVQVFLAKSASDNYCVFSQQYKDKWSLTVFKNARILDRMQCTQPDYDNLLQKVEKLALEEKGKYVKMTATEKILELCDWSDIIFIVKIDPLTRGGELIELTMIVCRHLFQGDETVDKVVLFNKKGIELSWMAKEMIELGKIAKHEFDGFEELWELTEKELEVLIQAKKFENVLIRRGSS